MRTDTVEAIAGEVGELIDAAGADPRRWQDVLEAAIRRMPGTKFAMQVVDRRAVRGIPMLAAGFEPGVVEAYGERYGAENPWAPTMIAWPELRILQSEAVMPAASLTHTAFHADWLSRGGGIDAATTIKVVDAEGRLGFACIHYEVSRAERVERVAGPLLSALGRRMRDALTLNGVGVRAGLDAQGLELLDAVAEPALIVTAGLRVVAANGEAAALLAEGRVIDTGLGDALAVPDPRLRRALEAEVAGACGAPAVPAPPVAPGGGWAVSAVRVRPGALRAGLGPLLWGGPLALVVLRRAAVPDPGAVLARSYRLTPAETRLALALGGAMSLREIAGTLGIGYATARSQLKSVFLKTGTSRQAELVALLLRGGAPH